MVWEGVPLWLDFAALAIAMGISYELCAFVTARRRKPGEGGSDGGYTLSGVFGLLALMMAFSASLALQRFDERRALVVAEANALGTLESRLALLGPDGEAEVRALLGPYVAQRVRWGNSTETQAQEEAFAAAEALHRQAGKVIIDRLRTQAVDPRAPLLLQPYNEAGDIAVERHAARDAHLPGAILWLLAIYCVAGAGILGHNVSARRAHHRVAALAFFLLLAAAFVIILDLDRPRGGSILVPQTELERTAATLAST